MPKGVDPKKGLLWLAVAGVLAGAVLFFRPNPARHFATPASCVESYFQALKAANEDDYLTCLDERLRAAVRERSGTPGTLANDLRAQGKDLRAWITVNEEPIEGGGVAIWVDQQFLDVRKRQKIVLTRAGSSWQIARLEAAQDLPQEVPYGTHVSKVPEGR